MDEDQHVLDLLPAYAIDCLGGEEADMVRRHLSGCASCRAELQIYQEVAAHLAQAVPQVDPPLRLKSELMARVRVSAQEGAPAPLRKPGWQTMVRQVQELRKLRLSHAWNFVSLVLILVLGASNVLLWQEVTSLRQSQASPLHLVALQGTEFQPGARGMIVISADGRHGTLVVDALPELDEAHQFQLWLIQNGERTSGPVFSVKEGYGSVYVKSPEPLITYSSFGVTIEPAGGSPGPTGEKVLGGDL